MFRKKQEQKPTHWQLPTYDGTKSYQNLLVGVYGIEPSHSSVGNKINSDTAIQYSLFGLIRSGNYDYSSGGIGSRSSYGYYWQSRIYSDTYARYLTFNSTYLVPQNNSTKGDGFTVRCLSASYNKK